MADFVAWAVHLAHFPGCLAYLVWDASEATPFCTRLVSLSSPFAHLRFDSLGILAALESSNKALLALDFQTTAPLTVPISVSLAMLVCRESCSVGILQA